MPWKEICAMDQKMELIRLWKSDRYSISELSALFDVSRKTAYKWIRRYETAGPSGLKKRSTAPRRHPNSTAREIVAKVIAIKLRHRDWGPGKVLAWLSEHDREEKWPVVSTMSDILKKAGLVKTRRRRHKTPPYTDPFTNCNWPNSVWSADFKGQFRMGNKELCYPLTITDSYSRYILLCKGLNHPNYRDTRKYFELVFKQYGLPEAIRTDNGAPFASVGTYGLSKLSAWFIRLGIRPERIEPGHPEQNGRHERMHRSLKEVTATPPKNNMQAQQAAFDEFVYEYNFERPHGALNQRNPAAIYQKSEVNHPRRIPKITYSFDMLRRKVSRNGEISWKKKNIFISKALTGEHIALRRKEEHLYELWFSNYQIGILDLLHRKVLPMCPD